MEVVYDIWTDVFRDAGTVVHRSTIDIHSIHQRSHSLGFSENLVMENNAECAERF